MPSWDFRRRATVIAATLLILPVGSLTADGSSHAAAVESPAAPTDVRAVGRFGGLRIDWTAVDDEANLVSYDVLGTPTAGGEPLTCQVLKGATPTSCSFTDLTYGTEYSVVVTATYTGGNLGSAAAATGRAGVSMTVTSRATGTTNELATPRLENDIYVVSLHAGTLTGNDFDLWACPDETIIPRDGQDENGECFGPNIESRDGRDENTFTLDTDSYGEFCNWLIILHDYSSGAHSNWIGPLLGADGASLPGCENTLATAPGAEPEPPAQAPSPAPQSSPSPPSSPVPDPDGDLPVVTPPGSTSGLVDGVPAVPTPSVPTSGTAKYEVGVVQAEVRTGGAGTVSGPSSAPVLQVVRDRVATVGGGGMAPGGIVEVWMPLPGGGSRQVALLPVGEDGSFDGALPFTGELDGNGPLPIGERTIQLFGTDANGQLTVINVGIRVTQPGPLAPEPERAPGAPPTLTPGQSLATSAGIPTPVVVTPLPSSRSTRVQGDGWLLEIDVPEGTVRDEAGNPIMEIVTGDDTEVRGTGFMPGTRAYVWIMSTPTFLGEVTVRSDGTFAGDLPVDVAPGQHTLQVAGVGTDGYIRAANLGVIVLAGDGTPRPTRVAAGEGTAPLLPIETGALALALAAGLAAADRTRRRSRSTAR